MLDDAICDFLGVGQNKFPKENSGLVLSRYGHSIHEHVQEIMKAFEVELTHNPTLETAEAVKAVRIKISRNFPEIGPAGLDALEWAFSYWYK